MSEHPEPTLSRQIADVIGEDHPDLERLCLRILRGEHPGFDAAASLQLLKGGMPVSVVMDGGLNAVWNLHLHGNLGAERAAELIAATVNAFALSPTYIPAIPGFVARVRYGAGTE